MHTEELCCNDTASTSSPCTRGRLLSAGETETSVCVQNGFTLTINKDYTYFVHSSKSPSEAKNNGPLLSHFLNGDCQIV